MTRPSNDHDKQPPGTSDRPVLAQPLPARGAVGEQLVPLAPEREVPAVSRQAAAAGSRTGTLTAGRLTGLAAVCAGGFTWRLAGLAGLAAVCAGGFTGRLAGLAAVCAGGFTGWLTGLAAVCAGGFTGWLTGLAAVSAGGLTAERLTDLAGSFASVLGAHDCKQGRWCSLVRITADSGSPRTKSRLERVPWMS